MMDGTEVHYLMLAKTNTNHSLFWQRNAMAATVAAAAVANVKPIDAAMHVKPAECSNVC